MRIPFVCLRLLPILLPLAILLSGGPLRADDDDGDEGATIDAIHAAVEKGEIRPLGDLKDIVRKRFPGDIVHIDTSMAGGTIKYEFRVLEPEGNLVEIEMDAASGRILEVENE
nr:PepSY domain-containing protein [uncultured Gellertiella sp.]